MGNFKLFNSLLAPFRKRIIFYFISACFSSFLFVCKSYSMKLIVDALTTKQDPIIPLVIYFVIWGIMHVNGLIRSWVVLKLAPQIKQFLTIHFVNKIMLYNDFYHQKYSSSVILNALKNIADGIDEILFTIRRLLGHSVLIITSLFYMYNVNIFYSFIAFIWVGLWLILSYYYGKNGHSLAYSIYQAKTNQSQYFGDLLNNISTVKAFNAIEYESKYSNNVCENVSKAEITRGIMFFKAYLQQSSFIFMSIYIFYSLINGYLNNTVTIGDLAMIIELFHEIYYHIFDLVEDIADISEMTGRVTEGVNLLNKESIYVPILHSQKLEFEKGEIVLSHLKYQYPDAAENEYSFFLEEEIHIKAGTTVAVVGPSGGGKTTLFKLLLRLIEPESGTVFIDEQNIFEKDLDSVRSIFALIPQEVGLFAQTIKNNICYGSFNATEAEIKQAAISAQVDQVINSLPKGYETIFGEDSKLSGGQKQRIMIARGLLRKAKIFLFDEATSALDARTESDILNNIEEITKGSTRFVIAHRLNTIKKADMILVFDKGRLVERGNHIELMANKNLYYEMMQLI